MEIQSSGSFAALEWEYAVEAEEHLTNLHRLKLGLKGAVAAWFAFGLVDWLVTTWVQPGPLWPFLVVRTLGGLPLVLALRRLAESPEPTARGIRLIDVTVCTTAALAVGVLTLLYGGVTSPYAHGLSLILIAEGLLLPMPWRQSLLVRGLVVLSFPATILAGALFLPHIRAQLVDPVALGTGVVTMVFLLVVAAFTLFGGHITWSLRRQVFASRTLGRYRLERRIQAGGMGEVWAAYHFALKREVAVKVLRPPQRNRDAAVARFEREVAALTALTHPNTVRVFDFGVTADGLWYYVMELLEGEHLTALVRREGPLSPRRSVSLLRQACGALAEAHEKGTVHRDVKPENLFLTRLPDGHDFIKVLDFGIAKTAHAIEQSGLTREGWIGGTPDYMSPEAAAGKPVGKAADVYSLGGVLYFLVCGHSPFSSTNVLGVLQAQINDPPEPPSQRLGRPLPADLEALVMRCLAKDPDARFADASELALALDQLADLPSDAPGRHDSVEQDHERPTLDTLNLGPVDTLSLRPQAAGTTPKRKEKKL